MAAFGLGYQRQPEAAAHAVRRRRRQPAEGSARQVHRGPEELRRPRRHHARTGRLPSGSCRTAMSTSWSRSRTHRSTTSPAATSRRSPSSTPASIRSSARRSRSRPSWPSTGSTPACWPRSSAPGRRSPSRSMPLIGGGQRRRAGAAQRRGQRRREPRRNAALDDLDVASASISARAGEARARSSVRSPRRAPTPRAQELADAAGAAGRPDGRRPRPGRPARRGDRRPAGRHRRDGQHRRPAAVQRRPERPRPSRSPRRCSSPCPATTASPTGTRRRRSS